MAGVANAIPTASAAIKRKRLFNSISSQSLPCLELRWLCLRC